MSINQRGDVRIISGSKRGSKLRVVDAPGLRPSGDRIREMVFAWLQDSIADSRCLDLYAGSGALGFEAASRGAAEVVLIEKNRKAVDMLRENAQRVKFEQVEIIAADATAAATYQSPLFSNGGFDLVFIDPPFADDLHQASVDIVQRHQLLKPAASVYIEVDKRQQPLNVPEHWQLHREKVAGDVRVQLYRVIATD